MGLLHYIPSPLLKQPLKRQLLVPLQRLPGGTTGAAYFFYVFLPENQKNRYRFDVVLI